MLNWLKERQSRSRTALELYGSIVAQARQPQFYADLGVPDIARGRFEVIALHVALVLWRLQQDGSSGQQLARSLSEAFVVDMDDNMREMSFSDLAVPREVKKTAAALFDRYTLLSQAGPVSAAGDDALAAGLASSLSYLAGDSAGSHLDSHRLAGYLRAAMASLAAQPVSSLLQAAPQWPAKIV